jgi:hypothetical protein
MSHVSHLNLLDKGRRHDRSKRLKNPAMSALVPGAGRVIANGALRVELPRVDGSTTVYIAVPRTEWCFEGEASSAHAKPRLNVGAPTPSPSESVKTALDQALRVIIDLERRMHAVQPESEIRIAAE